MMVFLLQRDSANNGISLQPITRHLLPGAIFIKHLRGKLKLSKNFGTELQQNQRTLQSLVVMVGCRSNSV